MDEDILMSGMFGSERRVGPLQGNCMRAGFQSQGGASQRSVATLGPGLSCLSPLGYFERTSWTVSTLPTLQYRICTRCDFAMELWATAIRPEWGSNIIA